MASLKILVTLAILGCSAYGQLAGEIPSTTVTYRLISVYTNHALTLDANDPDPDNKPYVVRPYVGSSKQHFKFESVVGAARNDVFYMKNVGSNGRYTQINYARLDEGAQLHEWQHETQANAVFKFVDLSNDKMLIMMGHSGMCLKVKEPYYGGVVEQNVCAPESSLQQWRIESVDSTCRILPDVSYRLLNRQSHDSQALQVAEASTRRDKPYDVLLLNRYTNSPHQQFQFQKEGFAYVIKARHSGMSIEVANFAYQDNVVVVQAPNRGAPGQKWRVEPALSDDGTESGYCFLIVEYSGKALDTQFHMPPNAGRMVVQSSKNDEAISQHWKIELI